MSQFITSLKLPFTFNPEKLKEDLNLALQHSWVAHYNKKDYQGDWDLIALMSSGGKSEAIYASALTKDPVQETDVLKDCPYFREILNSFDFEKITVRLMRLRVGAVIKPHKDNCLGYEDGEFRIHIPIITNPDVEFMVAGERVIMEEGTCWYFNANEEHSVANRGTVDRIHLVIDGIRNSWTDNLFFSQASKEHFERPPVPISDSDKALMIAELKLQDTPGARMLLKKLGET